MHKPKALNQAAIERIRERIKADRIIDSLENHILDNKEMSSSQVTAALGLLKKRVPDLQAIEHSGNVDHNLTIIDAINAARSRRTS